MQPFARPACGVVIRMLKRDYLLLLVDASLVLEDRLVEDRLDPCNTRCMVDLNGGRKVVAYVKRSDGKLDITRIAVGQGRPAVFAKATVDVDGRLKILWLATRPFKPVHWHGNQRAKEPAKRFLTHAAMADRGAPELATDPKAYSATLASSCPNCLTHHRS